MYFIRFAKAQASSGHHVCSVYPNHFRLPSGWSMIGLCILCEQDTGRLVERMRSCKAGFASAFVSVRSRADELSNVGRSLDLESDHVAGVARAANMHLGLWLVRIKVIAFGFQVRRATEVDQTGNLLEHIRSFLPLWEKGWSDAPAFTSTPGQQVRRWLQQESARTSAFSNQLNACLSMQASVTDLHDYLAAYLRIAHGA